MMHFLEINIRKRSMYDVIQCSKGGGVATPLPLVATPLVTGIVNATDIRRAITMIITQQLDQSSACILYIMLQ